MVVKIAHDVTIKLDDADIDQLGDLIAKSLTRALVNTIRILAKEGLLNALATPRVAQEPTVEATAPPEPTPEPATPSAPTPAPPPPTPPADEPEDQPPPPPRASRRSLRDIVRVVASRPPGYIDTNEGQKILRDLSPASANAQINQWVWTSQIKALIVANVKPPTKTLPGRLMVEKQSLVDRNHLRLSNSQLPGRQRETAPRFDRVTAA